VAGQVLWYDSAMKPRYRLLEILSDGRFHSGEELGDCLGVSRAAVWKHLQGMQDIGVTVRAVPGRGYRLPRPLDLLDAKQILATLGERARQKIAHLEVHPELDSTNTYLRERARGGYGGGIACLAEWQRAGRGRRGRMWVSPFGANICLSLLWESWLGVSALGGLSLAIGVGILRAMQELGIREAGLKWPNDVLAKDAKLAGILVEIIGESSGPCHVIVGVGVNVSMADTGIGPLGQPWIDLLTLTGGRSISRNRVAALLLEQLLDTWETFSREGLAPFQAEWQHHDVMAGRRVNLLLPDGTVSGRVKGIDSSGALLLVTENGVRSFSSGEISMRSAR
jgi:BirA family biotin operon repressor/biotin-[acetyl-CoA-carboxylase] ligase